MIFLGPTYQCELWFVISYVWKESRYKNWFCWFVIAYIRTITRLCHYSEETNWLKEGVTVPLKPDEFISYFGTVPPGLHALSCILYVVIYLLNFSIIMWRVKRCHCMLLYIFFYLAGKPCSIFWETLIILDLSFVLLVEVAQVNKTICSPL